MEEKTKVLVGQNSGLSCYRVYTKFIPNRKDCNIQVFYDEWLENQEGLQLNKISDKYYYIKNIKSGEIINNLDLQAEIIEVVEGNITRRLNPSLIQFSSDFNAFDNWFNYDVGSLQNGVTLGQIFETAIDNTLASLPIGCKSGWIITES